jgi:hypothetical protein
LLLLAVVGLACSSGDSGSGPDSATSGPADSAAPTEGGAPTEGLGLPSGPSPVGLASDAYLGIDYDAEAVGDALRGERNNPSFPPPLIDPGEIRRGGPPPDGIPPIDDPEFLSIDDVDFLEDDEAVVLVEIDGDARAYPVQVLIWHEIVNDVIGGQPVSVTYCPLCNSAVAYDRRYGNRVLDFGTSGELYQSALVMYDRQTSSLWAHFTGQGLVGHFAGAELTAVPAQTVSWATFAEAHPDGQVLSRDTGFARDYGTNPYVNYDAEDSGPIGGFFSGTPDETLAAKARVVGIHDDVGSVAVRLADVAERSVVAITEGDRNLVVFHQAGLASSLQDRTVAGGRDIGQTGVFVAIAADGTGLTFTATDDGVFTDAETGSTWNVFGQAVAGDLAGQRLKQVAHLDTFWFAWATYRPGSVLVDGG